MDPCYRSRLPASLDTTGHRRQNTDCLARKAGPASAYETAQVEEILNELAAEGIVMVQTDLDGQVRYSTTKGHDVK